MPNSREPHPRLYKAAPTGLPPITPVKLEAFERHEKGEPRADIARALRVTPAQVTKWIGEVLEARASERGLRACSR